MLNDLCTWQLHGKYPKPFKFEKSRRILEADCDLQNGEIPAANLLPPAVVVVVVVIVVVAGFFLNVYG